jgi:allophanate hydrolase
MITADVSSFDSFDGSIEKMKISSLRTLYLSESDQKHKILEKLIDTILSGCDKYEDHNIWISRFNKQQLMEYVENLKKKSIENYPLWGIPFAIKDNIDLVGLATTAGCPAYKYTPGGSAFVVQQLIDAGAFPVGKTNLDQFATGLVGTRSPYGACKNSIDPKMISGGSSSGSAVAVALGLVSFSLGTDTAGSGRIPAFLNNLVGVKPTLGTLSATGVIPACRTIDTISIFTQNHEDAELVYESTAIYDVDDDYARPVKNTSRKINAPSSNITIGIPKEDQLAWFGNSESSGLFVEVIEEIKKNGAKIVSIDFEPFKEAANLLYSGPWIAERYAAMQEIMEHRSEILHPITRKIINQAQNYSAVDCFKAMYQLQAFKKQADKVLGKVDSIMIPTAGTYYTIQQLEHDPIQLNTNLGYYTNFMNLLDYSALSTPAKFYKNKMPFGVTFFGPAFDDFYLLSIAKKLLPL